MSFCVDLWNGFDIIKTQIINTQKKLKTFSKLLSSYIALEINNCKNLENIYKEFKDTSEPEFLLDESFKKAIEIFDSENQNRKNYYNNLIKMVQEPLNLYLEKPKITMNKCFSDNMENTDIFNRLLNILIEKQTFFHNQCRELSSQVAIMEMDKINHHNIKNSENKCKKILAKVKYCKEDYLNCLKDTNKEREKYNSKTEEILSTLEEIYAEMIGKLQSSLYNFTTFRIEFYQKLIKNELKEFNDTHSRINPEKEIFDFIVKNATKEFPMIKFEFCPLKFAVLNKYVKSKHIKFPEKNFPNIYKAIKNYFDTNNIFRDDSSFFPKQKGGDSFTRRFTFFSKKPQINIQNDDEMKRNKEFLENYITDIFTGNGIENKEDKEKIKDKNEQKNKEDKTKENAEIKAEETINKSNQIETTEKSDNLDDKKTEENNNKVSLRKALSDKVVNKNNSIEYKDISINNNEEKKKEDYELNIKDINKNENKNNNMDSNIKENKEENNIIENKPQNNEIIENKEEKKIIENEEKNKEQNLENKNIIIEDKNTKLSNDEQNEKEKEKEKEKENIIKKLDFGDLIKLINNTNENNFFYIEILIKKLSYLRSKGIFKISDYAYKIILALFVTILQQNSKNDYILKNILILCQTFYKLQNNEKIYLQEGIKGREIFKSPETWHRVINYSMNLSCTDKDLANLKTNEIIEKINKESKVVVIAYLCDIKQYTDDVKVFSDVKDYYINVYNMDKDKVDKEVEEYMKMLHSNNPETKTEKDSKKKNDKVTKKDRNKENIIIENNKTNKKGDLTLNEIITNNNIDINTNMRSFLFKNETSTKKDNNHNEIINTNNFEIKKEINNKEKKEKKEQKDNKIKEEGESKNIIKEEKEKNSEDNINNIINSIIENKEQKKDSNQHNKQEINKIGININNKEKIEDNSNNEKEIPKEEIDNNIKSEKEEQKEIGTIKIEDKNGNEEKNNKNENNEENIGKDNEIKDSIKDKDNNSKNISDNKEDKIIENPSNEEIKEQSKEEKNIEKEVIKESVDNEKNESNQEINNDKNKQNEIKEENINKNNDTLNFVNSIINFIAKEEEKIGEEETKIKEEKVKNNDKENKEKVIEKDDKNIEESKEEKIDDNKDKNEQDIEKIEENEKVNKQNKDEINENEKNEDKKKNEKIKEEVKGENKEEKKENIEEEKKEKDKNEKEDKEEKKENENKEEEIKEIDNEKEKKDGENKKEEKKEEENKEEDNDNKINKNEENKEEENKESEKEKIKNKEIENEEEIKETKINEELKNKEEKEINIQENEEKTNI